MDKFAIDLCNFSGVEAVGLLLEKVSNPWLPMHIGAVAIERVTEVAHFDDGFPVYTIKTPEQTSLTFQFKPNTEPFSETAVDNDGSLLCADC